MRAIIDAYQKRGSFQSCNLQDAKATISQFEGECAPNIGLHFRFDVSDEDFEDHWCGFVPAATAQDMQIHVNLFK